MQIQCRSLHPQSHPRIVHITHILTFRRTQPPHSARLMAPRRTYAHRHLRLQPTGLVYKVLALARRLGAPADTSEILIILRSRLLFKEIHSRTVGRLGDTRRPADTLRARKALDGGVRLAGGPLNHAGVPEAEWDYVAAETGSMSLLGDSRDGDAQ